MAEQTPVLPHDLTLSGREKLSMTGVTEVVRFDDETIILHTTLGALAVHGTDLKLKTLSLEGGQVAVTGNIRALIYQQDHSEQTGWRRFFQ